MLTGHGDWVRAIAVTPDGRRPGGSSPLAVTPDPCRTVSASGDGTLKVWELETGRELQTFSSHAGGVNAVAVMPDGAL